MASNPITSDGLQPNRWPPTQLLVMASNLIDGLQPNYYSDGLQPNRWPPTQLLVMASNLIDGLQPNY